MKRKRFSVEQIVAIVKQAEMGAACAGVNPARGDQRADVLSLEEAIQPDLEVDQVRQLKQLQEENGRLKKLVAELTLDKAMLQDVLRKNW